MIISAITIENFKSIKEPVRIELKPITLLFGPNSVGKSTIIQALHYAREIILGAGPDAIYPETGGETVRLGGFANLVHNRDITKAIRFKVEFDLDDDQVDSVPFYGVQFTVEEQLKGFDEDFEYYDIITEYYRKQIENNNHPWIELIIRQDSLNEPPYTSEAIGFGDDELMRTKNSILKIQYGEPYRYYQVSLNLESPLFCLDGEENIAIALFGKPETDVNDNIDTQGNIFITKSIPYRKTYNTFLDIEWNCRIPEEQGNSFKGLEGTLTKNDALLFKKFKHIMDAAWGAHIYSLGTELRNFRYIGPLRERPDQNFLPQLPSSPSRWASGLAAWDYMSQSDDNIEIINKWLSPDYLDSGYQVVKNSYVKINIISQMYVDLTGPIDTPEHATAVSQLKQESATTRLFLKDSNNNTELLPTDVGVGISQVLPIIPLALSGVHGNRGIIAIEQPELHIHPAMQTTLGDLFIEGLAEDNNFTLLKRFLLETHSEHILLRLLRRIRENNDQTCEEDFGPDKIAIYFLEPGKNGVQATRIRVNDEGEFIDKWPRGFFNERFEELF